MVKHATWHHNVPDTYCVRVTAQSPPSRSRSVLHRHASTSRSGEQGFLGDQKQMCLLPSPLNSHKNTHAVLYTHAGGNSEPAPGPSRSDGPAWPQAWPRPAAPQTGKGRNWLQLWPSAPSILRTTPPFSLRQTVFKAKAAFTTTKASTLEHRGKDGGWKCGGKV